MTAAVTTATIPATKTHAERRVTHTPNDTGVGTHDGTVVVTEEIGVRKKRFIQDTYLVEEQPEVGHAGRIFLLLKDHTNGANADTVKGQLDAERVGNVYECRVYGEFGSCTCDGFVASNGRNKCVHLLALSALVEAGLPHPQAAFPVEPWPPAELLAEPDDTPTDEIEVEPYRGDDEPEGPAVPDEPVADWRVGPRHPVTGRPAYVIPPDQDMF